MGPELARPFCRLSNECQWLHWKWGEYITLFGSKSERIDLLNAAAASFFWIVQDSLWENILLHIAGNVRLCHAQATDFILANHTMAFHQEICYLSPIRIEELPIRRRQPRVHTVKLARIAGKWASSLRDPNLR